jgi:hypothetical protein
MTIPAPAATANSKGQGWRLAGLLAVLAAFGIAMPTDRFKAAVKTRQSCRNLKNGCQAQPDSKGNDS